MRSRVPQFAIIVAIALAATTAGAQHEGHDAAAPSPQPNLMPCVQAQPAVENIITAASVQLEAARQSNDPARLRGAIDRLQSALRDLRTQLAPCASAAAGAGPHTGHPAASPQPAPTSPSGGHQPSAAQPTKPGVARSTPKPASGAHAGHTMPFTPTAGKSAPAKTDGHAGHQMPVTPGPRAAERDPVTGLMVDLATAPKRCIRA